MKISAVNNISASKENFVKKQNFNGLWRKTLMRTDIDSVLYVPQNTVIRYYCPFQEESPEEIKKVLEDRQNAAIVKTKRGHIRYFVNECRLCMKLPFSKKQYEAYMQLDEDCKNNKFMQTMHKILKDKYTTDDLPKNQIPAYNPIIEKKFKNTYA